MQQPHPDEQTTTQGDTPHPYGPRVLVTTAGIDEKPAIYIPEGAVTRYGVERGIVLEVGDPGEYPTPPFTKGCVVMFHPQHGIQLGKDLKLVGFDCIVAWEDA